MRFRSTLVVFAVLAIMITAPYTVLAQAASTEGAAEAAASKGATASINGFDMYYEIVGEGEPLVLLHAGFSTCRMWDPVVAEFSKHYRLIIPDLRSHGDSSYPGGEITMRLLAEDVFALLDHLGIDKIKGAGTSAGAITLLHMATMQPERVEAMIVVGAGSIVPDSCKPSLMAYDADRLSEAQWASLRARHHHGDEQIRALFDMVHRLAQKDDDLNFPPEVLGTITARTFVVHGDRDYCFPATLAADMYSHIPTAYLWVLPNGVHVPIFGQNTEDFKTAALEFYGGAWDKK